MKINSVDDLLEADIPLIILKDINTRISDWLASGGSIDDPYIKQQFRFANNYLKIVERNKKKKESEEND